MAAAKPLVNSGYSFVYLVKEESSHRLFALKKIRCPMGDRALSDAMHEIDMYRLFQNEYIIRVLVRPGVVCRAGGKYTDKLYMYRIPAF